jgi:hypothetical protein
MEAHRLLGKTTTSADNLFSHRLSPRDGDFSPACEQASTRWRKLSRTIRLMRLRPTARLSTFRDTANPSLEQPRSECRASTRK